MTTMLERAMPVYHFREVHRRTIHAPSAAVWDALTSLTLDQLRITKPLVALRHLGRPPAPSRPLFSDGPLTMLAIEPASYALAGTVGQPWRLRPTRRDVTTLDAFTAFGEPGWTKYLTDFDLRPTPVGIVLSTETRGYSTDSRARRRFALYWAAIRGGSGLVRRDVLATVARLSER